jgi:hypothetical protein
MLPPSGRNWKMIYTNNIGTGIEINYIDYCFFGWFIDKLIIFCCCVGGAVSLTIFLAKLVEGCQGSLHLW